MKIHHYTEFVVKFNERFQNTIKVLYHWQQYFHDTPSVPVAYPSDVLSIYTSLLYSEINFKEQHYAKSS